MVEIGESWHELYDLERDPDELCNLFDAPEAQEARRFATERMLRLMIELQDRSPLPAWRA